LRWLLTALALAFLALFLAVPLVAVFTQGLANGWNVYVAAITEPYALDAIRLTLLVAAVSLPLNVLFGLAAAWAIAKFHFRGKQFLITLIDLPFAVSPVVAGMVFVLMFGARGWFGDWLDTYTSRSFSRYRGSYWPRHLSRFRSSRAS